MDKLSEGLGGFVHLAERQMLLHEERSKLVRRHSEDELKGPYHFITISRDIGALGDVVASEIARRLQWKVYDKEIVDYIAQNSHIRRNLVDEFDEKAQSLVHESLERWLLTLEGQSYGSDEYHVALIKVLDTLAAQGRAILLGRGGAYALRDEPGLHVRITASVPVRVRRLSEQWGTSPKETKRIVKRTDTERREFIQHLFKPDRNENSYFHIVFNTDHLSVNHVVAAIAEIIGQNRQPATKFQPPAAENVVFRSAEQAPG